MAQFEAQHIEYVVLLLRGCNSFEHSWSVEEADVVFVEIGVGPPVRQAYYAENVDGVKCTVKLRN